MSDFFKNIQDKAYSDIRLYLCPTAFINAPMVPSGVSFRLAGGLKWFGAFSVITVVKNEVIQDRIIPAADINNFLNSLPPELQLQAYKIISRIVSPRASLKLGTHEIKLDQPHVVGILNVTPDSFSDGGRYQNSVEQACDSARTMMKQGASLIDLGGESTRPGAKEISETEEKKRVLPVVKALLKESIPLSIDTRKASVIKAVWKKTPAIFNDVSALSWDSQSLKIAAESKYPVILMHHCGNPEVMQKNPVYNNVLIEVYDWLEQRIAIAEAAGIERHRIILDPGIGFGKNLQHNLELIRGIALFHGLGCPLMLGASRKKLILAFAGDSPPQERLGGSLAIALDAADKGVQLLRVHDVKDTAQALAVWQALH
ncbi:dihydropteroate synthase [Zymomonas mobilis]|uniref:dihydropteroate synthase n=1 Tax=Zymomonas mobilis subsp. pomaceae (strain ATCC 29192 / DSM 22645 / JCM 10191 / CCUG 17912 / NBRC 13757 / NCIMB 11200 / NRRL B-4491 / Barker I) TaxID=579138 RepID=F8EUF9_ZYMMT|nr:dihydropteroate synthase [Zymomonas mobilis]AEI37175.1 dihydropteroate synthase [Zymomonas mobilis subsp. pomaceae ATCC 29192]MDX5948545.1 dihydropteroate synthase [Zymomonas mobilis subsp. pomaceae]GEB89853.1 hypothetical protein ZMO02_14900 [Zymomonas mobilis subsp. pomaceae]